MRTDLLLILPLLMATLLGGCHAAGDLLPGQGAASGSGEWAGTGAEVEWDAYPAEEASTNAVVCGPSREYLTPEAEAMGRRYVQLQAGGEFIEIKVRHRANALVVRYCIPDAPEGGGTEATLSVSVNGVPQPPLRLSSRFAWIYGDYPWSNDPAQGRAHHFFDEARTRLPGLAPDDVLRLHVGPRDAAGWYLIDQLELEWVPPPKPPPPDHLCLTDFGAVADDGRNDREAFVRCLEAARESGQVMWIPVGTFHLDGPRIPLGGIRIAGAGMWYSRLAGKEPHFEGTGETVLVSDLAISGQIAHRDNSSPDNAFNGNFGKGSRFTRIWIEHVKCGFWTLHGTDGLVLRDSRIRNTMADGVNFCDGTSNSLVENCHFRNTGDDALATWSPTGDWSSATACRNNQFRHNTIEQPWLANGIGLYGGADHVVVGNRVAETVFSGAGIHVSSGFGSVPFTGILRIESNSIHSAGGGSYIGETVGALWLYAPEAPLTAPVRIDDLRVSNPAGPAISAHGTFPIMDVRVTRLVVQPPGLPEVHVQPGTAAVIYVNGKPPSAGDGIP